MADTIHVREIPNGSIRFNESLAIDVAREKRVDAGKITQIHVDSARFPISHELVGKVLRRKSDDEHFVISRMYMLHDDGYYMVGIYETNRGSSGQVNVGNISSPHPYTESQLGLYDVTDMGMDEFFGTESREWFDRRKSIIEPKIKAYSGMARIVRG